MAREPPRRPPEKSRKDYDVGYGKPPKATRFQKGQSGNPSGRPGAADLGTAAERVLGRRMAITIDGKRQKVPVGEAVLYQLVQRAMAGDIQSVREINRMTERIAKQHEAKGDWDKEPVRFSLNGIDEHVAGAAPILDIMWTKRNNQRLRKWVVKAAMARLDRPLSPRDAEIVRRATEGYPISFHPKPLPPRSPEDRPDVDHYAKDSPEAPRLGPRPSQGTDA